MTGKKRNRKHRLKKCNLTGEQYAKMAREQNNRCAICYRMELAKNTRYLSIDHDHVTGEIRGLLCIKCNTILGMAGDNVEILTNAINYLKR